ncbi:hypothetical protein [Pantoea sp. AS142]|uniref:hypothetical protein n=1 Tax=Pantoea sp. AS142 TaxID=3081292 RepID=UPI0030188650
MRVVNAMILATFLRVLRRGTLKNRFRRPKPDSKPARQDLITARTAAIIFQNLNSTVP